MAEEIPANITDLVVKNVMEIDAIASAVDFVFDAVDIKTPTGGSDKEAVRALEEAYAMRETPVVSAASVYRWTPDVPMIIPEHLSIIPVQRKRLGTLYRVCGGKAKLLYSAVCARAARTGPI